jgi:hypothetical protein
MKKSGGRHGRWIASPLLLLAMAGTTIGGGTHDRAPDSARIGRFGRDRGVGGIFVSAEILRLIARPDRFRGQTDFPMIASRSAAGPENPIDMLPHEHVWPDEINSAFGKN